MKISGKIILRNFTKQGKRLFQSTNKLEKISEKE